MDDVEAPTANPESSPAEGGQPIEATSTPQATGATEGTAPVEGQPQEGVGTTPPAKTLNIMGVQIDESKVPPELLEKLDAWNKSYTQKSQEASELRQRAQAFDTLRNNQAFQKWYYEQTNPQAATQGQGQFDLTPEKQAELLTEPKKFQEYVQNMALDLIQKVALPEAQKAKYEAQTLRMEQEVGHLAGKYKDFDDLNNSGKISEVLEKYAQKGADIDLEDAYWLAKRPFMESEAVLKAQQRVQAKVNGTTLPPASATNSGVKVVSAKGLSFQEKLRVAAEAAARGEKIQFDSNK